MTHDGTANVVSCEMITSGIHQAGGGGGWTETTTVSSNYDLILDVAPDGAPPFRTETRKRFHISHRPNPGDTLRVRCNPKKQAVEIDISEDVRFNPKLYKVDKRKLKEEHERLLHAAPGTPAPGYGDTGDRLAKLAELVKSGAIPVADLAQLVKRGAIKDPVADFAEMLKSGAITQAELDALKAKLSERT
jgi:hypothetical protein